MKSYIERKLRYWYLPIILGIIFIGLGVWALVTPAETFITLAMFFSIGFLFTGIAEIFYAVSNRHSLKNWGWYLTSGIVTFFIGLQLTIRPELSALFLSLYIGFWLLFRAVMNISRSLELKDENVPNWGWTLALGILGLLFSFILIWNPVITGITIAFWVGIGLITFGVLNIVLSISLKRIKNHVKDVRENIQEHLAGD